MNEDDIIQDGEKDAEGNVWYNGDPVSFKDKFLGSEDLRASHEKLVGLHNSSYEAAEDKYVSDTMFAKELIDALGTERSREIGKLLLEAEI